LLGTPSVINKSVHDNYPLTLEDGGRLALMPLELVDRLPILVAVRRFPCMGVAGSRSLRFDKYVRMQHFVRRYAYVPFRRFYWGDVLRREFLQRLFVALHGTIFVMLCKRAVPKLWHASLFLGLRPVWGFSSLFFPFCLVVSTAFSCMEFLLLR
jgi:hypothetical protein